MNQHRSIQRELAALATSPRPAPLSDELQAHLRACPQCCTRFSAWQELSGKLLKAPVTDDAISTAAVHSLHRRLQQALAEPPKITPWSRFPRQIALCAAIIGVLLILSNLPAPPSRPKAPLPPPTLWTYTTASPETLEHLLEQHAAQLLPPSSTPIPYALSSCNL